MPLADVNDVYTDIMTSVFSTTIAAKAWVATAAVILAVVQVLTGARMFGKLQFLPLRGPRVAFLRRWSGRLASAIERGGGGMPPAIVTGRNAEDVAANVASIAG